MNLTRNQVKISRYLLILGIIGSTAFIVPFANAQTKGKNPLHLPQELNEPTYQKILNTGDFKNGQEPIKIGKKRCTKWSKKGRRFCVQRIRAFKWKWGWEYK